MVTQKEVHILSRPSELQPVADYSIATQCTHREKDQDLPLLPSTLEAQETYTHNEIQLWNALYSSGKETLYRIPIQIKQTGVYHQASMLKIRCTLTEVKQTGHRNSQLSESEKAKFQTPAIPNAARNCVEHNSAENISQDLVHPTKLDIEASVLLILNQKKGRKLHKLQMYLHLHLHIHLHLHWKELRNSPTLQDPESQ